MNVIYDRNIYQFLFFFAFFKHNYSFYSFQFFSSFLWIEFNPLTVDDSNYSHCSSMADLQMTEISNSHMYVTQCKCWKFPFYCDWWTFTSITESEPQIGNPFTNQLAPRSYLSKESNFKFFLFFHKWGKAGRYSLWCHGCAVEGKWKETHVKNTMSNYA